MRPDSIKSLRSLLMLLLVTNAIAASAPLKTSAPANRCLIIVEASRAMNRRAEGVRTAIEHLVNSGIHGQLKEGDSLGLWTYSDSLQAGKFPLQRWSSSSATELAERLANFVGAQTNDRPAKLDKVMDALMTVSRESDNLLVLLISSGEQPISGTPFDADLNVYYRTWQLQQAKAQLPFVTFLRAQRGTFSHYAVSALPWPLDIPALGSPAGKSSEHRYSAAPAPARPAPVEPISETKLVIPKPLQPLPLIQAKQIPTTRRPSTAGVTNDDAPRLVSVPQGSVQEPVEGLPAVAPASLQEEPNAKAPPQSEVPLPTSSGVFNGLRVSAPALALLMSVALILMSRAPRKPRGSLITRSIEHPPSKK